MKKQERMRVCLAFGTELPAIALIVAPLLGGAILQFFSWREVFGVPAGFGGIAFAGCLLMRDTTENLEKKKSAGDLVQYRRDLEQSRFFETADCRFVYEHSDHDLSGIRLGDLHQRIRVKRAGVQLFLFGHFVRLLCGSVGMLLFPWIGATGLLPTDR